MICPAIGVIGDFFVDIQAMVPQLPVWDGDVETKAIEVFPGGSAANTARQLHELARRRGGSATFFGTTGQDALGEIALQLLEAQGFCTKQLRKLPVPSSACICLSGPKDRGFVSCYSTVGALSVDYIDEEALKQCQHIHIGGYLGVRGLHTAMFTELLKGCKASGCTISLGTNSAFDEFWAGKDKHLLTLLPLLDLLIVNQHEFIEISKALGESPMVLAQQLTVVETRGKEGAVVRSQGAEVKIPTLFIEETVDVTGAGDAFAAGFLFRWLSAGGSEQKDLVDSALWGNACSGCKVQRQGACVKPVSLEEVEKVYSNLLEGVHS